MKEIDELDVDNIKYTEMYVDEMKAVKAKWKGYLRDSKNNLKDLNNFEAEENKYELESLKMSYNYFILQIRRIINIYSNLINKAENCNLEEDDFLAEIKTIKLINNDLHIEYNKKLFKKLNSKYFGEKKNFTI